jgi:hypothetical protein
MTNLSPLSFNSSGNPTSALHTYTNTVTASGTPLIQFPNTAPLSVGVQHGGGLDQGVDPNYRDPQANQWNLTVEHQVGNNDSLRVSYLGMHSYRLSITEDLNQIPASTTPYQTTVANPYVDQELGHRNHRGRKDVPITDFFNTHAISQQLSGGSCGPRVPRKPTVGQ